MSRMGPAWAGLPVADRMRMIGKVVGRAVRIRAWAFYIANYLMWRYGYHDTRPRWPALRVFASIACLLVGLLKWGVQCW